MEDDVDLLFTDDVIRDPYPTYQKIRATTPVSYSRRHDVWAVSTFRDVCEILRDPVTFSSQLGMAAGLPSAVSTGGAYRIGARQVRVLIATDPPDHAIFRDAAAAAFSAQAIAKLRPTIASVAEECVAEFVYTAGTGECDFISTVAKAVPTIVLAKMLGVPPSMRDEFATWATLVTAELDEGTLRSPLGSGIEMFRYFRSQLRGRRLAPTSDLLTSIASAQAVGLTEYETMAFCVFLLVAGIETTASLLGNLLSVILHDDALQEVLRDDTTVVPMATEEALRYDSPVQALWRSATNDVVVGSQKIPAGSRLLVLFGSANRDETHFREPDRFLLSRPRPDHVAFGQGPHFCLGARLARAEVGAVVNSLLRQSSWLHGTNDFDRTRSVVLRGFRRMVVRAEPAPR